MILLDGGARDDMTQNSKGILKPGLMVGRRLLLYRCHNTLSVTGTTPVLFCSSFLWGFLTHVTQYIQYSVP